MKAVKERQAGGRWMAEVPLQVDWLLKICSTFSFQTTSSVLAQYGLFLSIRKTGRMLWQTAARHEA